ncbi:glycosyl transferase [Coprinopsis marcescibilis]|uniref:Glycosyl transferase n=1 Tax=Coprinopsis marcescibilis TaxID=230819 RepID=A0A5C3LA76_COPMA|nr:glycosyl transferase [Coprinopsis marcescibilis]
MTVLLRSAQRIGRFRLRPVSRRAILLFIALVVTACGVLHVLFTLYLENERYEYLLSNAPIPKTPTPLYPSPLRANATLLMLCRNEELDGVLSSVRQVEEKFNQNYAYPWTFLNDVPFDDNFKTGVLNLLGPAADVSFGLIPPEMWKQPSWINETRAAAGRDKLVAEDVIYGASVSYRNMCRFNSGFFYRHELLLPYRYYWRIEPDVDYFCDLQYDPFAFMEDNNKTYGFTMSLREYELTIATLWESVREFMDLYPQFIHPNSAMRFLSWNGGVTYNLCHFWSNFEIADMDFWRGEAYSTFFDFLESKGGFYYERWGDAPVHSIAVALFAPKESVHFFYDIGYRHADFQHCPSGNAWSAGRCACDPKDTFDKYSDSCTYNFLRVQSS